MPIEMLRSVVAPPLDPVDSGSSTLWPEVEAQIGCTLPGDYKRYINAYGSVTFGDFLTPFNPYSANASIDFIAASRELLTIHREIRAFECSFPYPIYPESGGILPWGGTSNGDVLWWLTDGEPDAWPVAITPARSEDHERYDGDMTAFLARWLVGDLVSALFPPIVPDRTALCVPVL